MRRRSGLGFGLASVALLALAVGFGSWLRDRRLMEDVFGEWSVQQVDKLSQGAYKISFTDPHFSWIAGRVHVDMITLTTDSAGLARHPGRLPRLRLIFHGCELSGVHVVQLATGKGLRAGSFGCENANLHAEIPPLNIKPGAPAEGDTEQPRTFLSVSPKIELPRKVPLIRVAKVSFPHSHLDLRQRRFSGAPVNLSLILSWVLEQANLDPGDPEAMARPLFSQRVSVVADSVDLKPSPDVRTRVGHLAIGLTDSTLEVRDFYYGQNVSAKPVIDRVPGNGEQIQIRAGRVSYAGLDLTRLAEGSGLRMRRLEVDSASLEVVSDKRVPDGPSRQSRLTPQQWIAELDRTVSIDSVILRGGTVTYREVHPDDRSPGTLRFSAIDARATTVQHEPGRPGLAKPMHLALSTRLMDEARMNASFAVPLDARNFALSADGHVGGMDITEMNRFLQRVAPVRFKSGRLDSIRFQIAVRNGVARGSVMPLYDDLALDVTGDGAGGLLGNKGIIGKVARAVAEVAVNELGVRRANPTEGQTPRAGRVAHAFSQDETLPAFLWNGLRDGLVEVIRKGSSNKSIPDAAVNAP